MQQLLILITVLLSSSQATSVSPTGSDNQLMCLQSLFPSSTISYALNGTTISLQKQNYSLQENLTISQFKFFTLIGTGVSSVTISCIDKSGLSFMNIDHVQLSNIHLKNCRLYFSNCTSVTLNDIVLSNTAGTGAVLENILDNISIFNVYFVNNENGGLHIKENTHQLSGSSHLLNIILYQVKFIGNKNGSGLLMDFIHTNVCVYINESCFINNSATENAGGGISIYGKNSPAVKVVLSRCDFISNSALTGGGIAVNYNQFHHNDYLMIHSCQFVNNTAQRGAAVHLTMRESSQHKVPMIISDCTFKANIIRHVTGCNTMVSEFAAVVTFYFPLHFKGHNKFVFNKASGLSVGATMITMGGNMTFANNTGMNGGGIAVYEGGSIVIREGLQASFINNKAINKGPALYFSHVVPRLDQNCFLRYFDTECKTEDWNYSMRFAYNAFGYGTNGSIYVSSLKICQFQNNKSFKHILCSSQWQYIDSSCTMEVFTSPVSITNNSLLTVVPGKNTVLPIFLYDELHHNLTKIAPFVSVSHNKYQSETTPYGVDTISSTPIIFPKDSFAPHNATIRHDLVWYWSVGDTTVSSFIDVYIMHCPPGFWFNKTATTCQCVRKKSFLKCESTWYCNKSYLKQGWSMTYDDNKNVIYAALQQFYPPLPSDDEIEGYTRISDVNITSLNNYTCGFMNRTGPLCSWCKNNTGVAVNTYNFPCVHCPKDKHFKRVMLFVCIQIIPAVIFCFLLTILNVKTTSGPMNAYIIFSQIITNPLLVTHLQYQFENNEKLGSRTGRILFNIIAIPYGIWNLDFFKTLIPPFCLFSSLTNINAWTLQYVSAVLPLIFIIGVYIFTETYACGCRPVAYLARPFYLCLGRCRQKFKIKTNLINTFATFFLLSYTKLCAISISLLVPTRVQVFDQDKYDSIRTNKLYLQPDYNMFGPKHMPYAIVALAVLVFLILLPPFLLIIHSCGLCKRCRHVLFITSFAEIFQGCYKDGTTPGERNYRYFSGIHLLLRLVILLLMNVQSHDSLRYFLFPLLMAFIAVLVTYCQPYKQKWVNLIDGIFFAILILVVMIFSPLNARYEPLGRNVTLVIIVWLFTIIPVLYMTGYFVYSLLVKFKRKRQGYSDIDDSLPYRLLEEQTN